ncbi:MAG: 4'-phosphopantetheinyl transferase superfamily protein [bacterium]|nr:4'-phosphopantetheinyl transferase superfamily protein [bacterium]
MSVLVLMARFEAAQGLPTCDLGAAKSSAAQDLLEQAMAQLDLAPWVPEKDPRGKPLARDGWHISKSHCRDCLAVAIARDPLGVDVEPIRLARVAGWHRVISKSESALLGEVDALAFTRLWTAKESALKIAGQGITELSKCRLTGPVEPDRLRLTHGQHSRLAQQHITEHHVISVCSVGSQEVKWQWQRDRD